jgi:hypothetical protein
VNALIRSKVKIKIISLKHISDIDLAPFQKCTCHFKKKYVNCGLCWKSIVDLIRPISVDEILFLLK